MLNILTLIIYKGRFDWPIHIEIIMRLVPITEQKSIITLICQYIA